MCGKPHECSRMINWYGATGSNSNLRVCKRSHEFFDRTRLRKKIGTAKHNYSLTRLREKHIDGRGLALAPRLYNEANARIRSGPVFDDGLSAVSAAARDHNNFVHCDR